MTKLISYGNIINGRYIFGCISELFNFTVDGFDPVIFSLLWFTLESHDDPAQLITGVILVVGILAHVFDMLKFVHLKCCIILSYHVSDPDLVDAETKYSFIIHESSSFHII